MLSQEERLAIVEKALINAEERIVLLERLQREKLTIDYELVKDVMDVLEKNGGEMNQIDLRKELKKNYSSWNLSQPSIDNRITIIKNNGVIKRTRVCQGYVVKLVGGI